MTGVRIPAQISLLPASLRSCSINPVIWCEKLTICCSRVKKIFHQGTLSSDIGRRVLHLVFVCRDINIDSLSRLERGTILGESLGSPCTKEHCRKGRMQVSREYILYSMLVNHTRLTSKYTFESCHGRREVLVCQHQTNNFAGR